MVEQLTLNQWALGSSPRWCTKKSLRSQDRGLFFGLHHGREQGGRPQAATNTTVRCWLARGRVPDGAPGNKTCERFRLRVFFCVVCGGKACGRCTIPYGAGSCCAAVRLAFASRGPVAKNSALHCFLNAPADGAPGKKTCERFRLRVFFCYREMFSPG